MDDEPRVSVRSKYYSRSISFNHNCCSLIYDWIFRLNHSYGPHYSYVFSSSIFEFSSSYSPYNGISNISCCYGHPNSSSKFNYTYSHHNSIAKFNYTCTSPSSTTPAVTTTASSSATMTTALTATSSPSATSTSTTSGSTTTVSTHSTTTTSTVSATTTSTVSITTTSASSTTTPAPPAASSTTTTVSIAPPSGSSTLAPSSSTRTSTAATASTTTTANSTVSPGSNTNTTKDMSTNSTGNMTTAGNFTSMISCRAFTCNASACYTVFMNQTASPCAAEVSFCELRRQADMSYSVGCGANCSWSSERCVNQTQAGCTVDCCNSTGCLNSTLYSMVPTTGTTPLLREPTGGGSYDYKTHYHNDHYHNSRKQCKGKKCHKLTCTGEKCYQADSQKGLVVLCPNGQDYCHLKKTVSLAVMTWTAGCSGNCMSQTVCTSTAVDCYQECCNATTTASCLKLDGTLNMPNSAPGPRSLLALMTSSLLVWLLFLQ
ncbi:uncharacterized protein DDB_G0271670-like [Megalops cyprinoides]|uniref:uncharacterized protein DDB_G0271670-like n=1 Tax=Megalops cyprinoides TaxID=118141 RepID=UPI00186411AA|nr:uncharacterized protein DDB_G0271670-like [Megalops cyprinoides]